MWGHVKIAVLVEKVTKMAKENGMSLTILTYPV